jgi:hypothetical protein
MLPHAFLRPFPMGLVPAVVSPRMSGMLHHLRIHQKVTRAPALRDVNS